MALTQITFALSQLESQRTGYMAVSLTEWATTNAPSIAAGSLLEVGSSLLEASGGDIACDEGATKWAAVANSTQVYCYALADFSTEISTTAPTWNDALQGWYNGTKRCYASVYKDSSGNYILKKIAYNRNSFDAEYKEGNNTQLKQQSGVGNTDFIIKKPISSYFIGTSANQNMGLQIYQNGSYRTITTAAFSGGAVYFLQLNPGSYRLFSAEVGTATLYCSGLFSDDEIIVSEIVT